MPTASSRTRPLTQPLLACHPPQQNLTPGTAARSRYRSTVQTMTAVVKESGALTLWNGFTPYYCRCGGHTVSMFVFVELLRGLATSTIS